MSMQTTDPIADLLTRIRNAKMVGKTEIRVPSSKLKKVVAEVKKNGKYVFYVRALRDGIIRYKCFRYTYLDENKMLILFKQRDVTDMHCL